jgi:hypothetical protein
MIPPWICRKNKKEREEDHKERDEDNRMVVRKKNGYKHV